MHPPQQTIKTLKTADSKRATPINERFGTVESQKALSKSSHLNPIHSNMTIINNSQSYLLHSSCAISPLSGSLTESSMPFMLVLNELNLSFLKLLISSYVD